MTKKNTGTLLVIASAAGFGTLAIFIKIAYGAGANAITILAARFLIAALALASIAKVRGTSLLLEKKVMLQLCLLGAFGFGAMSILFALSLHYLPASLAAMLLYTYPALVALLSFALGDERFSPQKGLALAICSIGLACVLGVSFSVIHPLGIWLGLGAAVIYSCYIVISNRLLKSVDALAAATYVCASTAALFVVLGVVTGAIVLALPLHGWLAILSIAIFPTIIGILGLLAGMARVGAANASIISTVEPLITVILAVLLLSEPVMLLQAAGGTLILCGILILQLWVKDSVQKQDV